MVSSGMRPRRQTPSQRPALSGNCRSKGPPGHGVAPHKRSPLSSSGKVIQVCICRAHELCKPTRGNFARTIAGRTPQALWRSRLRKLSICVHLQPPGQAHHTQCSQAYLLLGKIQLVCSLHQLAHPACTNACPSARSSEGNTTQRAATNLPHS